MSQPFVSGDRIYNIHNCWFLLCSPSSPPQPPIVLGGERFCSNYKGRPSRFRLEVHWECGRPGLKAPFTRHSRAEVSLALANERYTHQRAALLPSISVWLSCKTKEASLRGRTVFPCWTEAHADHMKSNISFCPAAHSGSVGWNLMLQREAARWKGAMQNGCGALP